MRLTPALALVVLAATPGFAQYHAPAAIAADGLVYLNAVTAMGADVNLQATRALGSISATLEKNGATLDGVAHVSAALTRAADVAALDAVFARTWPKDPPARTTFIVDQPLTAAGALVELSVVAIPAGGERIVVLPDGWQKPPGHYSYGIKTGNTLFLAGLVSRNATNNMNVSGDMTAQTKTIMTAAAEIFRAAGMSLADAVASRVFIADAGAFQAMNAEYRTHFPAAPPARATARATLPGADHLVGIAMIGVKDARRQPIVPPDADGTPGRPGPNLSPAIQVGRRLYVAGITGSTPDNKGDVASQTRETLARIQRILTSAGYDWSHVIEMTVFLPDMERAVEAESAYRNAFEKNPPVRFTIGTPLMGADALVEIMLTAVK